MGSARGRIQLAAAQVLARAGLQLDATSDDAFFTVGDVDGDVGSWPVTLLILEDDGVAVVYAAAPETIPPERLDAVGELCHRVNLGLFAGCFELDVDDGLVRVRAGGRLMDGDDGARAETLVHQLLSTVTDLVAEYGQALGAVVGGADPAAAVAAVEEQ